MSMKIAVSIPDPLFEEAERVSQRLRIPRSQLYARALQAFVRQHSGEDVTARMNAALERIGGAEDPGWETPGLEVMRRETW
jgi:metal-responsive CopG/Arc/MetJ family transcriptional regulator